MAESEYQTVLASPDVKTAVTAYELAQTARDSISRKLCGGSTAVNIADLARAEGAISNATTALVTLARQTPILERHPAVAAMVTHN